MSVAKKQLKTKPRSPKVRKTLRILVANGVNLDLLGRREPEIYGSLSLTDLENEVRTFAVRCAELFGIGLAVAFTQSNDEGAFLEQLSQDWDGMLINPGAWGHTSLALADRLKGLGTPFVEVHLSNVAAREPIRQHSHLSRYALGVVSGLGIDSYRAGIVGLIGRLLEKESRS